MNLQLAGRTALVTGASMGIGRSIAASLAKEGVRLAVMARRRKLLELALSGFSVALRARSIGLDYNAAGIFQSLLSTSGSSAATEFMREFLLHRRDGAPS